MGIKEEVERLRREEKERIQEEKTGLIKAIDQKVALLNESARRLIIPSLEKLKQSGAIEVLEELRTDFRLKTRWGGAEEAQVDVNCLISYPAEVYGPLRIKDFRTNDEFKFKNGQLLGGWDDFRFGTIQDDLSEVRKRFEYLSGINPGQFKLSRCAATLRWGSGRIDSTNYEDGTSTSLELYEQLSFLLFPSGGNQYLLQLVYEPMGPASFYRAKRIIAKFPEDQWNKGLLRKAVAEASYSLLPQSE